MLTNRSAGRQFVPVRPIGLHLLSNVLVETKEPLIRHIFNGHYELHSDKLLFLHQPELDQSHHLAARPTTQATMPTIAKNTTAVQACGSGSLFVTIATAIVSAAIPDIKAIAIQHQ